MLKPFQKLQFGENDSATLRADLLNKLSGGASDLFSQILKILGNATSVSGSSGGTFTSSTVDFTSLPFGSVKATIADTGVTAASKIVCSIAPVSGRSLDELELGPAIASAGNIVAGASFDVIAVNLGGATGQYTVSATRN